MPLTIEEVARRWAAGVPLTIEAVAMYCSVSSWTVRAWIDSGKLACVRLPGRLITVRHEALERLLERCEG